MRRFVVVAVVLLLVVGAVRAEDPIWVTDDFPGCFDPSTIILEPQKHSAGGEVFHSAGGFYWVRGSEFSWELNTESPIYVYEITYQLQAASNVATTATVTVGSYSFISTSANPQPRTYTFDPVEAEEIVMTAIPEPGKPNTAARSLTVKICADIVHPPESPPEGCPTAAEAELMDLFADEDATGGEIINTGGFGLTRRGTQLVYELDTPVSVMGYYPGYVDGTTNTRITDVTIEAAMGSPNPTAYFYNNMAYHPATEPVQPGILYLDEPVLTDTIIFDARKIGIYDPDPSAQGAYKYTWMKRLTIYLCVVAPTYLKPLVAADEAFDEVFSANDWGFDPVANLNYAISKKAYDPVYAIASGTVVSVDYVSNAECGDYTDLVETFSGACLMPEQGAGPLDFWTVNAQPTSVFTFYEFPIYIVRVYVGDDDMVTYLLTNPKATPGDSITAGCKIGDTVGLYEPDLQQSVKGGVFIGVGDRTIPSDPDDEEFIEVEFENYPSPGIDCNIRETLDNLLVSENRWTNAFDGYANYGGHAEEICKSILAESLQCFVQNAQGFLLFARLNAFTPQNLRFTISKSPLEPVYSNVAGTVINVEQISVNECLDYTSGTPYTDEANGCVIELPRYALPNTPQLIFFITMDENYPVYRVQILTDDGRLATYLLTDPMVDVGNIIKENCLLGRTIPVNTAGNALEVAQHILEYHFPVVVDIIQAILDLLFGGGGSFLFDGGGVVIQGLEEYNPETYANALYPVGGEHDFYRIAYNAEPTPGLACNVDPDFADCLTINPFFNNNGEFWENLNPTRPAIWLNPGVVLKPLGGIRLPALPLSALVEYGASFKAASLTNQPGILQVGIGQTIYNFDIQPGTPQTYTIDAILHQATVGNLYDVVLNNIGTTDIQIDYFCLTEGDPTLAPGGCYFKNPAFDLGLTFWTTSGTVSHVALPPEGLPPWDLGYARMVLGGSLQQNARLLPNEDETPHVYKGYIDYAVITGSWSFEIFYTMGGAENYLFQSSVTGTGRWNFEIEVADEIDGMFAFAAEASTGNILHITKMCILGPFPGQGGGGEDNDPGTCDALPPFDDSDTVAIIIWHWQNLDHFFQCQLMPMLTKMWLQMVDAFVFATRQSQFWMYTTYRGVKWLGTDLLPWLAGYLSNVAPGTIIINNQQCTGFDLICLLSGIIDAIRAAIDGLFSILPIILNEIIVPIVTFILWVLTQAINLLFAVLTAMIVLALQFLAQILSILGLGRDVLAALINTWNTAPAIAIPGLPNCSSSVESLCLIWWVADNTMFSGVGSAIIPALAGLGWMLLGIWVVKEIKAIVIKTGQTA